MSVTNKEKKVKNFEPTKFNGQLIMLLIKMQ